MPASTKVIVTNDGALKEKYGAPALARIHAALDRLAAADWSRGISTRIVALDSATDMKAAAGIAPLRSVTDEPGTKKAIDAIFKKLLPDYLVIVGAPDVVTHQSLTNPVRDRRAHGDPDKVVPSDLPYACDVPYGADPRDFIGATRVVGRIPDLENWKNPAYLLSLLAAATAAIARAASDCTLDADITSHVTRRFALLERSGVMVGTVVAAGCGYGAQLYDPSTTVGGMGIASRYLGRGACGYLGSTTTAYGATEGGGSADLMCRYFLRRVNKGASIGRAMLEARQHFIATSQPLDPVDLKTLAQFILLGDPSVHPVAPLAESPEGRMPESAALYEAARISARALRRETLARRGLALAAQTSVAAAKPSRGPLSSTIRRALEHAMSEVKLEKASIRTFEVPLKADKRRVNAKSYGAMPRKKRFHIAIGTPTSGVAVGGAGGTTRFPVVVVATEVDGALAGIRHLYAR